LTQGFYHLGNLLNVLSGRVAGWSLSRHLEATIASEALAKAMQERKPPHRAPLKPTIPLMSSRMSIKVVARICFRLWFTKSQSLFTRQAWRERRALIAQRMEWDRWPQEEKAQV
jgi:hypothetical protein